MRALIPALIVFFSIHSAMSAVVQPNLQNLAVPTAQLNSQPTLIPSAPNINANGYTLMDANSGKIIASKNMDERMGPASLTKLMTLYVTMQALKQGQIQLTDNVRISETAWRRGGSRMFLKLGSQVTVQQLMEGVIVASGNDACTALAEYVAGNEDSFAQLMNQTAARLGMSNSHFIDSTGLPSPDHYSTPHDLAILTQHIVNDFPEYYPMFKEKWIAFNGIRQPNRNRLLWRDPSVDGLKTGHTEAAGFCLVSSAVQGGMRLISIVMGTPSDSARADDSQALLNWGFRFYKTYKLYSANQSITTPHVYLGTETQVALGPQADVYITIPNGEYNLLKASMEVAPKLKAPILKGETYGVIKITLADQTVAAIPLVALQDDNVGGFWTRTAGHVSMLIKSL